MGPNESHIGPWVELWVLMPGHLWRKRIPHFPSTGGTVVQKQKSRASRGFQRIYQEGVHINALKTCWYSLCFGKLSVSLSVTWWGYWFGDLKMLGHFQEKEQLYEDLWISSRKRKEGNTWLKQTSLEFSSFYHKCIGWWAGASSNLERHCWPKNQHRNKWIGSVAILPPLFFCQLLMPSVATIYRYPRPERKIATMWEE